ncbi:hypothetical protein MIND_00799200 [Mycena indigotica]|uniref:Uncharacterized protein n=1 Tax=Mycena indigotica TaxID=2126181 RepID=A0A8H6SH02_9AGAR|nr:uncharacterized protein MIND_00799200 [Mycena indigotica]KAF7298526.1 hypothetical protein MIND_00799200 [Mycena indigotica]
MLTVTVHNSLDGLLCRTMARPTGTGKKAISQPPRDKPLQFRHISLARIPVCFKREPETITGTFKFATRISPNISAATFLRCQERLPRSRRTIPTNAQISWAVVNYYPPPSSWL